MKGRKVKLSAMTGEVRSRNLNQVLKDNPTLLKPFGFHGYIAFLELATDESVTLDFVYGSNIPWRVSRPGTMYRQGKEISIHKQHRFKSLSNAIDFLRTL